VTTPDSINIIPDAYLGRPFAEVRSELIGLGLQVDGVQVFDPAPPGTVTDINPSGPVQAGETIKVTYSKGPEQVTVPNISAGSTEAEVRAAIEKAGLRWVKGEDVAGEPGQEAGTFVRSEPGAGSKVEDGSVVTYHLARALITTPPETSPTVSPSAAPGQG
jgi:serine/threonine-protein kinase